MAPAAPPRSVRLVPLGGLGEIGMNCLGIEQGDDVLVVDCGIRFPHDDLGVDVIHPDFRWLVDRADKVRAVFLTHGHEDHIGALPYLLNVIDVPVFGPPHALELARRRLYEHGFSEDELDFRIAHPKNTYSCGDFDVEPVRVAHSIVDATALSISTAVGTIVHSGDFNFDADPPDGEPTDEDRLSALGRDGVSLLLSDSTNIDVPDRSRSERDVGRALAEIIAEAPARVHVALFASNIQRLIMLGHIAAQTGRKICALGRSLDTQIDVATQIGRLAWPSDLRIPPDRVRSMPKERVLVIAGGTQGEPGSAMARLASGTHPDLVVEEGDTVVFSSRVIPGNDVPFMAVLTGLLRTGARVITWVTRPDVHASGHASRSEQSKMIRLLEPRSFLPIHGNLHHLLRHAELARTLHVRSVAVVENGTSVVCDGSTVSASDRVTSGAVHVGIGAVELSQEVRKQRVEMARYGVATVSVVVDRRGALVSRPSIAVRGVPGMDEPSELRAVSAEVARDIESRRKKRRDGDLADDVRRTVRRKLLDVSGVKPVVVVHVVIIDD